MGITSALVLFAVIWFMVLFVLLPIGLTTQGDEDDVLPGTHAGSPARFDLRRKLLMTTAVSAVLFVVIAGVIVSGAISVRDLDWWDRMEPLPADGRDG